MQPRSRQNRSSVPWVLAAIVVLGTVTAASAQGSGTRMDIYGFAMLDMGYQFKQNDPSWFDVLRPTKLPSFENEFGEDGRWFSGVRQSRLGVKTFTPTSLGELRTTFEFELYGVGVDAGQTTFRLRHAYGELGKFGAGQTWSPFMDIDVFPNTLEYWGPCGMVFFRNVQFRYMPIQGDTRLTFALERPGASGDLGDYQSEIEAENVKARFPLPDLSGEYRWGHDRGYVELAGIVRYIQWDDLPDATPPEVDLAGDAIGWGVNLSSNIKVTSNDVARLQVVYGEGAQNYMNDAPVDIGLAVNAGNPNTPVTGEPLPMLGVVAFLDHSWNERFSSSLGYSMFDVDNSDLQSASAFKRGHYALANLLFYPASNVMMGGELQWGRRENNTDDFTSDDFRIQFSAKYNFAYSTGGAR